MDEIGKRRLATVGIALAGFAYFLVFAQPLSTELVLVPRWARAVSAKAPAPGSSPAASGADRAIPFKTASLFGYLRSDGEILFAAPAPYGLSMERGEWAAFDRESSSFAIRGPEGGTLSTVKMSGYPFFAGGRRFVLGPDQASITELDRRGEASWTYRFPSIVTSFDAGPRLAVFGLLDGSIAGIDPAGARVLDFAPGGSRIAAVYGVAVSADGSLVAAITGLDRQRLVILEKRSSDYRVLYHRWLLSDFRRPVDLSFTEDGRRVVYESYEGVGVWDLDGNGETVVAARYRDGAGLSVREGRLLVLLAGLGTAPSLICAASPDRRVVDITLPDGAALVAVDGDSIFLGVGDSISRCDLEER